MYQRPPPLRNNTPRGQDDLMAEAHLRDLMKRTQIHPTGLLGLINRGWGRAFRLAHRSPVR